jgi:anaerobic selenocysteine-containing dehydrogenase
MTNSWTDIANATLVVVMGANPSENHPACMAHINNARRGPHKWYDGANAERTTAKRAAKLIVIDPRYTRTASQSDTYIRIRPGTDIAFINAVMKRIIETMSGATLTNWLKYMNYTGNRTYSPDGGGPAGAVVVSTSTKWTDARVRIMADGTDYQRASIGSNAGVITGFPVMAASIDAATDTVYNQMVAHLAPYTTATAASICGCDASEIELVAQAFIDNCRFSQTPFASTDTWTPRAPGQTRQLMASFLTSCTVTGKTVDVDYKVNLNDGIVTWLAAVPTPAAVTINFTGISNDPTTLEFQATTMLYAMGLTQHTNGSQNVKSFANLQMLMGNAGRPGGGINALRGIHNVQGSTDMGLLQHLIPGYSGNPKDTHSFGSYLDSLYGNSLQGGTYAKKQIGQKLAGINYTAKLAGAAGNLYTVAYLNPGASHTPIDVAVTGTDITVNLETDGSGTILSTAANVKTAIDGTSAATALVWTALVDVTGATGGAGNGTGVVVAAASTALSGGVAAGDYLNAYTSGNNGLQQRGYYNMLNSWFAGKSAEGANPEFGTDPGTRAWADAAFGVWPKVNGDNHITMFRKMIDAGTSQSDTITFGGTGGDVQALAKTNVKGGTVVVVKGATTCVEGTDFSINYMTGKITRKTDSAIIGATDTVTVTYDYGITAAIVWGMNPAITEPNQSKVRAGLKNLDLLVVVDMFATETAQCDRKDGSTTYLIPACSHVEEAGSVCNSGRVLQWRERATKPKGNSKADLELITRFAKALDDEGCFAHIKGAGATGAMGPYWASGDTVFSKLWSGRYGWTPSDADDFEAQSLGSVDIWRGADTIPSLGTVSGSEVTAERVCREMTRPQAEGGTIWIYLEGFDNRTSGKVAGWKPTAANPSTALATLATFGALTALSPNSDAPVNGTDYVWDGTNNILTASASMFGGAYDVTFTGDPVWKTTRGGGWVTFNRAKARNAADVDGRGNGHRAFKNWGYSWLVNRRVLYNNGDAPWDQADGFQGPEQCARFFVSTNTGTINYAKNYRTIHLMADRPDLVVDGVTASPHFVTSSLSLAGRFPAHTEPYETKETALLATWGRNTKGTAKWDLVPLDTEVAGRGRSAGTGGLPAGVADLPAGRTVADALVLTTIRCVEHFQGGPITRNNSYNVEAEPAPWIEINSADARTLSINDGDPINVITARSNSTSDQLADGRKGKYVARAGDPGDNFGKGFIARVGVGLSGNQRVAPGVVAIPWHWGEQGLSTGSRANDLCIDAGDANTSIPEYKACLCWLEKA